MKAYGRVRYVTSYEDAPDKAYIIREMGDLTVRLEYYWPPDHMEILTEFPQGAFSEDKLESTLIEARKIMGNKKTLWVERPIDF